MSLDFSASSQDAATDLLYIDHAKGLSYCMDDEDFYKEILDVFCDQYAEDFPNLEAAFQAKDWKRYAGLAHGFKGNTLNIGAVNVSALCLEHELAGKADDGAFIESHFEDYAATMKALVEKVKGML